MVNKLSVLGLGLGMALGLSSCEKWLDATPPSEMRAEQHYNNVLGFQQTLTGCYIAMTADQAYGKNLTWYAVELMGHQVQNTQDRTSNALFRQEYNTTEALSVSKGIWDKLYNVAVNVNDALAHLEERKDKLNELDYKILKGEFIAIRAYVHFDLLRLFGHGNYAADEARLRSALTVPYLLTVEKNQPKQLTMGEFYAQLSKDIAEASELLKASDPLVSGLEEKAYEEVNTEGFYKKRHLHLNYYALKGLEARVNLWFGTKENLPKALNASTEVIKFFKDGGYNNKRAFDTVLSEVKASMVDASFGSSMLKRASA